MSEGTWLVQIYRMADDRTQASAAGLLSSFTRSSVDTRTCERGSFLIVECDAEAALSVFQMVLMADRNAELIHSTTGPVTQTPPVRPPASMHEGFAG